MSDYVNVNGVKVEKSLISQITRNEGEYTCVQLKNGLQVSLFDTDYSGFRLLDPEISKDIDGYTAFSGLDGAIIHGTRGDDKINIICSKNITLSTFGGNDKTKLNDVEDSQIYTDTRYYRALDFIMCKGTNENLEIFGTSMDVIKDTESYPKMDEPSLKNSTVRGIPKDRVWLKRTENLKFEK